MENYSSSTTPQDPEVEKQDSPKLHRIDEEFAKEGFEFVGELDVLRNPNDDYSLDIWKKKVKGKTDRFIQLYEKTK